jgi:hypothetical protein
MIEDAKLVLRGLKSLSKELSDTSLYEDARFAESLVDGQFDVSELNMGVEILLSQLRRVKYGK